MGPTINPKIQAPINIEILLTRELEDELIDVSTSEDGQKSAWATPARVL